MTKIEQPLSMVSLLDSMVSLAVAAIDRRDAVNGDDNWAFSAYNRANYRLDEAREEINEELHDYISAVVALELAKRGIEP